MDQAVMVAMSGGVDSAAAALLLAQSGLSLTGGTLLLRDGPAAQEAAASAAAVCERLGIPHRTFDLRQQFSERVIAPFEAGYLRGETPNPCIACNRSVKFTGMREKAAELGISRIATGHYARIERDGTGRLLLRRGADRDKDQSYVLYVLSQETLSRTLFPLGELTKREVRQLAAQAGFSCAGAAESQDICFVPDGDYAGFLERRGALSPPGAFVTEDGREIGTHRGLIRYTVGQRRGLGIAAPQRLFVLRKEAAANRIVLGPQQSLLTGSAAVTEVNWVSCPPPQGPLRAWVSTRYRQTPQPAWLHPGPDGVTVEFDRPQPSPAPGQAAVFYDPDMGDYLLGGGTIRAAGKETS